MAMKVTTDRELASEPTRERKRLRVRERHTYT